MSCEQPSPDQRISGLSYRPSYILNGMISIPEPAKPSAIERDPNSSSIGLLDILPVELLQYTLHMLDFRSLSHLSRVSLQGNEVVRSLPAYRNLMKNAPHALAALGHTSLISLHSANALYGTLLSEQCISCGEYGAFLFLPTCERCCYECLCSNQSLWVIPTTLAKKCFDLTPSQLKLLPITRSIPGVYFVGHRISRQRQLKLTSVKAAKELGIKIHGSTENMAEALTPRRSGGITEKEYYTFRGSKARHCCRSARICPGYQQRETFQTTIAAAWHLYLFLPSCQIILSKMGFGVAGVIGHLNAIDLDS